MLWSKTGQVSLVQEWKVHDNVAQPGTHLWRLHEYARGTEPQGHSIPEAYGERAAAVRACGACEMGHAAERRTLLWLRARAGAGGRGDATQNAWSLRPRTSYPQKGKWMYCTSTQSIAGRPPAGPSARRISCAGRRALNVDKFWVSVAQHASRGDRKTGASRRGSGRKEKEE